MTDFNKIIKTYYELIDNQDNQVDESIGSQLATASLIGSTLLGSLNAANLSKNSSKTNKTSGITQTAQKPNISLNADELFIAKTIYSETSTLCTYEEIVAVACVIQNRIGLKDFGNCENALEVCKKPGSFTAVSNHNSNWDEYTPNLNKFTYYDARLAKALASPNVEIKGASWMKDIVYYHDKSIQKPRSWDNKYYKTVLVKITPKFKFYKVIKRKKS